MTKPNGYVLFKNSTVAVIATGVRRASANIKTGRMVQVWIIRADMNPLEAIATGKDKRICGTCPHRGIKGERARTCYVQVDRAPNGIYKAFKRGRYPFLAIADYASVFTGKAIRFGAYGDPAVIPAAIVAELAKLATRHTGYTHQWRTAEWLRPFVMASCDTLADYIEARARGWRTFRVTIGQTPQPGEILCPASSEAGMKTQCARCGLCNGARDGVKSIYIPVHGSSKKSAFTILQ